MPDKIACQSSKQKWKTSTYSSKDGRSIVISEAKVADAGDLVAYKEQVCGESDFLSFGPGELDRTVGNEEDSLADCLSSENRLFLVARISDRIVGALSFVGGSRPRLAHSGEMAMTVIRDHWKQGVGGALIDEFLKWCEQSGVVKKANLHVRTDNERALRLYLKKGFEIEGTVTMDMCIDGVYYDHHIMGRVLNQIGAE